MAERAGVELREFGDALRAETFKLVRRRMTYISLAVFVVLIVVFYVILWLRMREGPGDSPQTTLTWLAARSAMSFRNAVPYGLALERFFATLICAIFAGAVVGNEYDWRTVGVVTSRGVRRWHFLLAKLLAGLGFTAVTVTLGLLVALAMSAWFTNLYGLAWGGGQGERYIDAVFSLARTFYVVMPFVLLAVLFATVWRSAGVAVGATLGVFFLEGIFITLLNQASGWPSAVPDFFFNENIEAVLRANGTYGERGGQIPFAQEPGGPPLWRAALVLGAWSVGFVCLAFWQFHRRDINE